MSTIITPTVGRQVWYRPSIEDVEGRVQLTKMEISSGAPLAATIIAVWSDRCVSGA